MEAQSLKVAELEKLLFEVKEELWDLSEDLKGLALQDTIVYIASKIERTLEK